MQRIHPLRLEKIRLPMIIGGAIVLILVLLSIRVAIEGNNATPKNIPPDLETRLTQLENRIANLESMNARLIQVENMNQTTSDFIFRVEKMESQLPGQLDQINQRLSALEKHSKTSTVKAHSKPQSTVAVSKTKPKPSNKTVEHTAKKQVTQPTSRKSVTNYHVVQKGDNLFRISKKYGLTLQQLLQLNQMKEGDPIHPGQRLIVKK